MDFVFTADQLDLRENARKVLESTWPPPLVRQAAAQPRIPDERAGQ